MLTIKDLDGKTIIVTDLKAAIKQAGQFKDYHHVNATPRQKEADKEQQVYWKDVYDKLLQLQTKFNNAKK